MESSSEFSESTSAKKGDRHLQCVVVTPERTLIDEVVDFVALPLYDGELGILPMRSPLIGRLGYGELRTKADGAPKRFFIDGGFVQVRDDVVTVLTNRAIPAASLDATIATAELEKANQRSGHTDFDVAEKAKAAARARAQIRVASRLG